MGYREVSPKQGYIVLSTNFEGGGDFLAMQSAAMSPGYTFLPYVSYASRKVLRDSPYTNLVLVFLVSLPEGGSKVLSDLFRALGVELSFPSYAPPTSKSKGSIPYIAGVSTILPYMCVSTVPGHILANVPSFRGGL